MIIAKDEAERVAGCTESVASVSDETLVVRGLGQLGRRRRDSPATGLSGPRQPLPGYGPQRNFGADHATHDWILWLDADERVGDDDRRRCRVLTVALLWAYYEALRELKLFEL